MKQPRLHPASRPLVTAASKSGPSWSSHSSLETPEPPPAFQIQPCNTGSQGGTVNNTSSTIISDTGLTTQEITTASRHLSVTRGFLLESVGGLSAAQWDFKPASDTWSAAENMEHIVLIESGIHAIIEGMNEAPGPPPEGDRRERGSED